MWELKDKQENKKVYKHSRTGEECTLSEIYSGQEGVFYTFDNLLVMPIQRQFIFDEIRNHEQIGINKEELEKTLQEIKENYKNEAIVYHKTETILNHLKNHWDASDTAMLVAAVLIIEEGESIDYFNQETAKKKLDKWKLNSKLIGFFLTIASEKCKQVSNTLNRGSRSALKKDSNPQKEEPSTKK